MLIVWHASLTLRLVYCVLKTGAKCNAAQGHQEHLQLILHLQSKILCQAWCRDIGKVLTASQQKARFDASVQGLVNLTAQQMDGVLGMRNKYCANLNQILQDRLHLLDFINKRLLNIDDPAPCTLVASADAEVAAFDAVTHLQENLTAHVDNFVDMLRYTQTIYTPFQVWTLLNLQQASSVIIHVLCVIECISHLMGWRILRNPDQIHVLIKQH